MGAETTTAAPAAKKEATIADLKKAFERDGTMEPGYTYRYQTAPDGNAELVIEKRG